MYLITLERSVSYLGRGESGICTLRFFLSCILPYDGDACDASIINQFIGKDG